MVSPHHSGESRTCGGFKITAHNEGGQNGTASIGADGRKAEFACSCEDESSLKMSLAVLPALLVLALTVVISLATGHPRDLFLSHSASSILIRFVVVTPLLVAPIAIVPRLLTLAGRLVKNNKFFGWFVKTRAAPHQEFTVSEDLVLRPLQGMALSMVFAERFLDFLVFSTGASYASIVIRSTVFAFLMLNPLISLFLSFMWTFDDLGVKIYSKETGETRMLGRSIGIILPLVTGAIGVSTLFHRTYFMDAVIDLLGGFMVLYPPYVLFVILHHEYVRRRFTDLSRRLPFEAIETKVRHSMRRR